MLNLERPKSQHTSTVIAQWTNTLQQYVEGVANGRDRARPQQSAAHQQAQPPSSIPVGLPSISLDGDRGYLCREQLVVGHGPGSCWRTHAARHRPHSTRSTVV